MKEQTVVALRKKEHKVVAWRKRMKIRAIEYKGGKCARCGYLYAGCVRIFTFHHLDPSEKEFKIGSGHCYAWETMVKELDKCIMLCLNCHAELHDEEDAGIA